MPCIFLCIQSSVGVRLSEVPREEQVAAERPLFADQKVVSPEPSPERWAQMSTEKTALGQALHDHIIANISSICKSENKGQTSNITLLTVASGFSQKYSRVLAADRKNLAKFNDNAEVCIVDHALTNDRDLAWSKVIAIRALLEVGKQTIVWMDADALAFNPKSFADVETSDFTDEHSGKQEHFIPGSKSILFTNDFDADYYSGAFEGASINCGVMIIRNTPWSTRFWKSVWEDFPDAIMDRLWEQRAVLMYRDVNPIDFAKHTLILPHRTMNTWMRWFIFQPIHYPVKNITFDDAFIIHAAGYEGWGDGADKYDALLAAYCEYTHLESCN